MGQIENALHDHYATAAAAEVSTASRSNATATGSTSSATLDTPFAKVNSVAPSSPAEAAGMRPGDKIQRFGEANWLNHEKLSKVAQIVSQNEGVSLLWPSRSRLLTVQQRAISVQVRRQDGGDGSEATVQNLTLVPRVWSGRGLLGCHLLPL